MEIYGSVSFQSSVSTYGSVTFQSSVKLVMEIYRSVSEAGELGLRNDVHWKSMETEIFSPMIFFVMSFSVFCILATERRQSRKAEKAFFQT